jgi:hypothetical protein
MGDTINWGIFKRRFWGELLRHQHLANILRAGIKGGGTVAVSLIVALKGDPLLFITVPSALLLIGAAKGTSKWLEQNIPKMLSKATRRLLP